MPQIGAEAVRRACHQRPPSVLAYLRQDRACQLRTASREADDVFSLLAQCFFPEPPEEAPGRRRCPQPDCPQRFSATRSFSRDPLLDRWRRLLTVLAGCLRFTRGYFWQLPPAPAPRSPCRDRRCVHGWERRRRDGGRHRSTIIVGHCLEARLSPKGE